jgi:hypothetical protein
MINHVTCGIQPVILGYGPEVSDYVTTAKHGLCKVSKKEDMCIVRF